MLLGCSYAQGYLIPPDKRPAKQLANMTNRSVYNFAYGGGSIQHNYYRITDNRYTNGINPEYIIYVFINEHINRIYRYQWLDNKTNEYLRYNDDFTRIKPVLTYFWKFHTVKCLQELISFNKYKKNYQKSFDYFLKMMLEIHKITKEKWPESKFIILVFPNFVNLYDINFYENFDWSILKDNGIEIVTTDKFVKLTDDNKNLLLSPDKLHPSAIYWEKIFPELTKKFNM